MRRLDSMADKLKALVDERRRVLDGLLDEAAEVEAQVVDESRR